jgi:putative lumazine-binding protein
VPTDVEAVQRVCADYIEAWLDGDVDRMRRCLHPQLAKRRVKDSGGTLHEVPTEDMIADVLEGPKRGVGRDFEIAVFDVARDVATAKVLSEPFVDYLHLARVADGWVIVNAIYERRRADVSRGPS